MSRSSSLALSEANLAESATACWVMWVLIKTENAFDGQVIFSKRASLCESLGATRSRACKTPPSERHGGSYKIVSGGRTKITSSPIDGDDSAANRHAKWLLDSAAGKVISSSALNLAFIRSDVQ